MFTRRFHAAGALAALVVAASAWAQGHVGGPGGPIHKIDDIIVVPICPHLYVDPANGNDVPTAGSLNNPYRTLSYAMGQAPQPAVIVALPGIYSPSTNGEPWPLFCRDKVSIQGFNALNTVFVGEGSDVLVFFPGKSK